jgi:hypothetical protein
LTCPLLGRRGGSKADNYCGPFAWFPLAIRRTRTVALGDNLTTSNGENKDQFLQAIISANLFFFSQASNSKSFIMSADGLPSHFTLNTGAKIPTVGFGTWQAPNDVVEQAVAEALACGYRHIDGASIYRNETGVGAGIRKSGVSREDIFITGKLWNTKHDPADVEAALDKTLADLGVDYLDLFLMHWAV